MEIKKAWASIIILNKSIAVSKKNLEELTGLNTSFTGETGVIIHSQ